MKGLFTSIAWLSIIVIGFTSCSKELSSEGPGFGGIAAGTLLDSLGNCQTAVVKGQFKELETLTDSNYILVKVNFTTQGKYTIFSDTTNGMWFRDSGFAFVQGANTIKLKGKGQPILPGTFTFQINFGNSACLVNITTTGSVNNGATSADYLATKANGYIDYELSPAFPATNGSLIPEFRATIAANSFSGTYNNSTQSYTRYSTMVVPPVHKRKDGTGKYYEFGTPEFEYFFIYDTVVNEKQMEYVYLDESKNPGQFFETDSLRVGFTDTNSNTMVYGWGKLRITTLFKGRQLSLLGTQYTDIITVKRELFFKADGQNIFSPLNFAAEISYAKGIGLVDQRIYETSASGTTIQSITIKGWNGL